MNLSVLVSSYSLSIISSSYFVRSLAFDACTKLHFEHLYNAKVLLYCEFVILKFSVLRASRLISEFLTLINLLDWQIQHFKTELLRTKVVHFSFKIIIKINVDIINV